MSWLSKFWSLYPALIGALVCAALAWLCLARSPWALLSALLLIYLVPPCTLRLHEWLWPLAEGTRKLIGQSYEPWWGAHQIQLLYIAVPELEAVLRIVPGAYSAWLRLWGSRVGKRVVWTPRVEIVDRQLLEVGDDVVFGHYAAISGHLIQPTRNNMTLYVERVRIGSGAFVGAGSVIAPGSVIGERGRVEAGEHVYPAQQVA